jgi:hypothetical protein
LALVWGLTASRLIFWQKDTKRRLNARPGNPGRFSGGSSGFTVQRRSATLKGESLAAAALGDASDIMMAHPLGLQLLNLRSLVEISVDNNTTVVLSAPLMTNIAELGSFLYP